MSKRKQQPNPAPIKKPLKTCLSVGYYGVLAVNPKGFLELTGTIYGNALHAMTCKRCRQMARNESIVPTRSRQQANAQVRRTTNPNRRGIHGPNYNRTSELKPMLRAFLACRFPQTAAYMHALTAAEASVAKAQIECKNAAFLDDHRAETAQADTAADLIKAERNLVVVAASGSCTRKFCGQCIRCVKCVKGRKNLCPSCTMCQNCATGIKWIGGTNDNEIVRFIAPNTPFGRDALNVVWRFLKITPTEHALSLTKGFPLEVY